MKKISTALFIASLTIGLLHGGSVLAYTGAYGVAAAPIGGPASSYVTQFDLDTTSGPAYIPMNLNYVYAMQVQTSTPVVDHILIKEYPSGSGTTFDVIVPQPVQNALVSATIYIWAPDDANLTVRHEHNGSPTVFESAAKVDPLVQDGNGNVLWAFTVSGFSSFTYLTAPTVSQTTALNLSAIAAWFLLVWFSLLAPFALRNN